MRVRSARWARDEPKPVSRLAIPRKRGNKDSEVWLSLSSNSDRVLFIVIGIV